MHSYSVVLLVAVLVTSAERIASVKLTSAVYPATLQNGFAPTRLLRRYVEDGEERVIGGGTIAGLVTKAKVSTSKLVDNVLNIKKYEAQVAKTLELRDDNIDFTAETLERVTYVVKKFNSRHILKKVSVIGTLIARYGDIDVAKKLVSAGKKTTPLFAAQIQTLRNDLMKRWLDAGNSVDDIFKLLKISDGKFDVVASRKLDVLDDYIKFVEPKKHDQTSLIRALIKGFGSEDKVVSLLKRAKRASKKSPVVRSKANALENSLLSKLLSDGKLPNDVFKTLKLHDDIDYAFTSENFIKFTKYVADSNRNKPRYQQSAIEIYTSHFRESAVVNKLVRAMDDASTKTVAKKLQEEQVEGWINSTKNIGDVFRILKIKETESEAITRRKLDALVKFIIARDGDGHLISTLTEHFRGKGKLASILQNANSSRSKQLQEQQFAAFVKEDVTPENFMSSIFKVGIDSATDVQKTIFKKFERFYQSHKSASD